MIRTRLALATVAAAALTGTLVTSALPADAAAAHLVQHRHWYEVQTGFSQNARTNTIEFTDRDFSGRRAHHSRHYTATDHFTCVFGSGGVPTCDGQLASGNSMLLVHGRGGQGSFDISIVGGTGVFAGARGTLHIHDLDAAADRSNLSATFRR